VSDLVFQGALDALDARSVLPTEARTAVLQLLAPEVRNAAFFSAGVTKADFLEAAQREVRALTTGLTTGAGGTDLAGARVRLRQLARALGYGEGGMSAFGEPLEDEQVGGLTDLTGDWRLNLILQTNREMALGAGYYNAGQSANLLKSYPCQELFRAAIPKGGVEAERPWPEKWANAGGQFYDGRMIARKDDPIWLLPLEAGGFNRFGNPYPPFDFNSWMRTRDTARDEAVALGVIGADDDAPAPAPRGFFLQAQPLVTAESALGQLLSTALRGLAEWGADGVLKMATQN
jgi:hypothetical protein